MSREKSKRLHEPGAPYSASRSATGVETDPLFHARLLGLRVQDKLSLAAKVEDGFSYQSFIRLQKAADLTREQLADLVQITQRTLARRKAQGRLKTDESERLLRVSRVFNLAVDLHEGDPQAARVWLERPNRALNGKPPFELARTEVGAREVETLVTRLEHGVFS
ncbi:MAG TPA: antitoxin Xre/MbcA/ParS toxin-binding domain-containing protein [Anaerolineales bacterium]|nr:antitoxin Xre/MbcA/ParS toxin-binding domain-containing protein [Anaerolineales bacterium]